MLKVKEGLSAHSLNDLHILEEWRLGLMTAEIRSLYLMARTDLRSGRSPKTVQRKLADAIANSPETRLQRYLATQMGMMHFVLFEAPNAQGSLCSMEMWLEDTWEDVGWTLPFLAASRPIGAPRQVQENLQSLCAVGLFLADLHGDLWSLTDKLPWTPEREQWVEDMRRTARYYLSHFCLSVELRVPVRRILSPETNPQKFLAEIRQTVKDFWAQEGSLWSPLAG